MRITIDRSKGTLTREKDGLSETLPLYSPQAFEAINEEWLRIGWNQKYSYRYTWLGRPVVQLPDDLLRIQEVIWDLRPDLILETGVAMGGSLVFYASLCQTIGRGRVVGVDIEIRPQNRKAIESHPLAKLITLIEGDAIAPATVQKVGAHVRPGERILVILDSNHARKHVLAELEAYAPFVSKGSYIVATDGVMRDLHDTPRGRPEWKTDNPYEAARDFLAKHPEFRLEPPKPRFNEGEVLESPTYWPGAWLRRTR